MAEDENCVNSIYAAVKVYVAHQVTVSGECDIVHLCHICTGSCGAILAIGPFKGVFAVFISGEGICGPIYLTGLTQFVYAVDCEDEYIVSALTAYPVVKAQGIACGHVDNGTQCCRRIVNADIIGLQQISVTLVLGNETVRSAVDKIKLTAFDICSKVELIVRFNCDFGRNCCEYLALNIDRTCNGCSTGTASADRCAM